MTCEIQGSKSQKPHSVVDRPTHEAAEQATDWADIDRRRSDGRAGRLVSRVEIGRGWW